MYECLVSMMAGRGASRILYLQYPLLSVPLAGGFSVSTE